MNLSPGPIVPEVASAVKTCYSHNWTWGQANTIHKLAWPLSPGPSSDAASQNPIGSAGTWGQVPCLSVILALAKVKLSYGV
jgi:hypothetical protein